MIQAPTMSLPSLCLPGLRLNLGNDLPLLRLQHHGVNLVLEGREEFINLQELRRDVALLRIAADSSDISRLIVLIPVTAADIACLFQIIEQEVRHGGFYFHNQEFPRFSRRNALFEAFASKSDERFLLPKKKFQRFIRVLVLVDVPYVCHNPEK